MEMHTSFGVIGIYDDILHAHLSNQIEWRGRYATAQVVIYEQDVVTQLFKRKDCKYALQINL